MTLLELSFTMMAISLPRIISPSPLSFATAMMGAKQGWRTGIKIAYGHTAVLIPIVILLGIGTISLETFSTFKPIISILGSITLFTFAGLQIYRILKKHHVKFIPHYHLFLTGIFLTALNPFFHIWWFTVGFKLLSDAFLLYSFIGLVIVLMSHMWMDYAWFIGLSILSKKGKNFLSEKYYNFFTMGISIILMYFGIVFLQSSDVIHLFH